MLRVITWLDGFTEVETIQTSAVFEGTLLRDLVPEKTNRAHELIENIMVAANGVAARWLQSKGQPALRRVLRSPEHWDRIVALAAEHHAQLPATPDPVALNAFLAQCRRERPDRRNRPGSGHPAVGAGDVGRAGALDALIAGRGSRRRQSLALMSVSFQPPAVLLKT